MNIFQASVILYVGICFAYLILFLFVLRAKVRREIH